MGLFVSSEVRGLFLVLTGEQWPGVDEDVLRELGVVLVGVGEGVVGELVPLLVGLVGEVGVGFRGRSARRFVEVMSPLVGPSGFCRWWGVSWGWWGGFCGRRRRRWSM